MSNDNENKGMFGSGTSSLKAELEERRQRRAEQQARETKRKQAEEFRKTALEEDKRFGKFNSDDEGMLKRTSGPKKEAASLMREFGRFSTYNLNHFNSSAQGNNTKSAPPSLRKGLVSVSSEARFNNLSNPTSGQNSSSLMQKAFIKK